jgi:hypothetical protein
MNDPSKWKNALLKSGLPLEVVVGGVFSRLGFHSSGEFAYLRPRTASPESEFSVDLLVGKHLSWGELQILVECKYAHPTVNWLFGPRLGRLRMPGLVTELEELSLDVVCNRDAIYDFERGCPRCEKGVALHADDVDQQAVHRGLQQLRYALPWLVYQQVEVQADYSTDSALPILAILVTTADLRILKSGFGISDFEAAKSLEEISSKVDYLIVENEAGPALSAHARDTASSFHRRYPHVTRQLKQRDDLVDDSVASVRFNAKFHSPTEQILVVQFSALESVVGTIVERLESLDVSNVFELAPGRKPGTYDLRKVEPQE